jgi:phosphatidylinositol glycan class W
LKIGTPISLPPPAQSLIRIAIMANLADNLAAAAAEAAASPSYKQLKEDFVSNLSGGSVVEIAQVCAVAPV